MSPQIFTELRSDVTFTFFSDELMILIAVSEIMSFSNVQHAWGVRVINDLLHAACKM